MSQRTCPSRYFRKGRGECFKAAAASVSEGTVTGASVAAKCFRDRWGERFRGELLQRSPPSPESMNLDAQSGGFGRGNASISAAQA